MSEAPAGLQFDLSVTGSWDGATPRRPTALWGRDVKEGGLAGMRNDVPALGKHFDVITVPKSRRACT
jgi:hypothetical protein